ncbi:MAG: hypothetical protein U9R79_02500 [Armatimonadota bacterium]|nr:hypothetical protein [Armatimonadota bacterium]
MRPDDADELEEMQRQHELGRLVSRTKRAIDMGRLQQAQQFAHQAAELAPDTTTVEELLGDLAMAKREYTAARDHYQRALEIEPINADAEEKLGEAVLHIQEGSRLRQRMEEAVDHPEEYKGFRRNPVLAAFYSVIPGLGQLYNHEYEKGLAMAGVAMLLLAWILSKLLTYFGVNLIATRATNPQLEREAARQVVEGYGPLTWTLIVLAIAAYLAIWIYSIVDAYRVCTEQAREADELGVELEPER